uniref:Uncharacterized protein n=1 Tax=Avena sativa TaxID=4498 RepID=A0ACD5UD45_AVESA
MKASCFLVVLLLAVATGSRLSLAARETSGGGGSSLGRELGEFFAKAGNFLTSAGRAGADGWHSAAAATEVDASSATSLMMRHGHGGGRKKGPQKRLKKASVNCIPADMCRRKKVLCGKRCYRTSHAGDGAGAGVSHIPSNRCVVRCKKCVPTC